MSAISRRQLRKEMGVPDELAEPAEGILVFDENLRPVFCNKAIRPLCLEVCTSGVCVLEKQERDTPELFKIIRRFRGDWEKIIEKQSSRAKGELIPHSIIYFSPQGNFTIRCMRLHTEIPGEKRPMWQVILHRAVALHNFDFDLIDSKYGLTDAELRVLKNCLVGMTTGQIAGKLSLSKSTVKSHLHHIFEKLGVARRSQILSRLF